MKRIFLYLLLTTYSLTTFSQEILRSEKVLITSVDTSGITYYQVAMVTEYEGGRYDSLVTERKDSATFVAEEFIKAHNNRLPLRQATQTLAFRGNFTSQWSQSNQLLLSITGSNYFNIARSRGIGRKLEGVWRIIGTVDTTDVNAFFLVDENGLGEQIDSPGNQTPVPDGLTVRFNPYSERDFRMTQLFPSPVDIVYLIDLVDENNPNSDQSKRELWSNSIRSGEGGVRCIKLPF